MRPHIRAIVLFATLWGLGCSPSAVTPDAGMPSDGRLADGALDGSVPSQVARHSSSIAIAPDGLTLYVANADADSVSVIDTSALARTSEIALGTSPLRLDATTGRFDPTIGPRAIALAPTSQRLYVTGQWSGELIEIDVAARRVSRRVLVGAEPVGVVVTSDEASVFVACAQDGIVVRVDVGSFAISGTVSVAPKPWALGWSANGDTLYVSHLLGPGMTAIAPSTTAVASTATVPNVDYRGDRLLAYGEIRGLYDVVARPGTTEIWMPHLLLGTQTAEMSAPTAGLDFESTVFPGLSVLDGTAGLVRQLTVDSRVPGVDGQFGDIVSGPHAIEFTSDGRFAFVLDAQSEDVLVVDAERGVEATLLRPLPGHMPQGLVLSPDGTRLYVEQRASADVAVIDVRVVMDPATGRERPTLAVAGPTIPCLAADPMPSQMRLGQTLFFTANSDAFAVTQNHWVACASCHIEARSDAVVWRFLSGPRDTPSNAGGSDHTGFLLHTADRRSIRDYWHTINDEQGGAFSPTDPTQSMQLDALRAFVDHAIPYPMRPSTDATLVARGQVLFERADVGCASCHLGDWLTDSGAGNASLDLAGPVLLHDVGTCDTGVFPDVAHEDAEGHSRAACQFDTPSLRGVADSWPYLHDGSAATLRDVLEQTRGRMGDIRSLSDDDLTALVEYLRSL